MTYLNLRNNGRQGSWKAAVLAGIAFIVTLNLLFFRSSRAEFAVKNGIHISSNSSSWHGWSSVRRIFIFGDSYTATRFDIAGRQPSSQNPLGNPAEPELESKHGATWPVYLTTLFNSSKIQTYNLAHGGAVVDNNIIDAKYDFTNQVAHDFDSAYARHDAGVWNSDESLFATWFGINDIQQLMEKNVIRSGFENKVHKIMKAYRKNLGNLFNAGARNFLIFNVPPTDQSPLGRKGNAYYPSAVSFFNDGLAAMAASFAQEFTQATVLVYDANAFLTTVITNPAEFLETIDLANTNDACASYANQFIKKGFYKTECGAPIEGYFWHDELHPTYIVQKALAENVAGMLAKSKGWYR